MSEWRMARSLEVLLSEINVVAPKRDKSSDGGIGDAAHQSRVSDHNPWCPPPAGGVVTARDFDHDPANGLDCEHLARHLRARAMGGDRRIKYIIFNRQICSATAGWAWRPYAGANAHTRHLHLSVAPISVLFDDLTGWGWVAANRTPSKPGGKPTVTDKPLNVPIKVSRWGSWYTGRLGGRTVQRWDAGTDVRVLQTFIGTTADGYFGSATENAVRDYQRMRGYKVDGVVGPQTWGPILQALGVRR